MKKKIFYFPLTLLLLGSITFYFYKNGNTEDKIDLLGQEIADHAPLEEKEGGAIVKFTDDQIKNNQLQIQTALPGNLTLILSTRGKIVLDPDKVAHITSNIPAKAKEIKKNIGNYVRAGEVIALLESEEIADAKAAYLTALSKEKLAFSLFKQEQALYQKKISSNQEYETARNFWEEAKINFQLAIEKLQAFGIDDEEIANLINQAKPNLRAYNIYAPIDGIVIKRDIMKGQLIDPQSPIYEIVDLSTVWLETTIYPHDLPHVKEGQLIEVSYPNQEPVAHAQLLTISPIVSKETLTSQAIAILDNPHGQWHPGTYVDIKIPTHPIACSLLICNEAIQKIEGTDCAFIQTEKGFEKRILKLGLNDQAYTEVLSGINQGERYVGKNSFLLKAELQKNDIKDDD